MSASKSIRNVLAVMSLAASTAAFSADIIPLNFDPPGVGFNDPTPVDPVGGNPGTTLGEQRQYVFSVAAQAWGDKLQSDQPIFMAAFFQPLTCSPTTGVLGSAGPTYVFRDFPGAPLAGTWYVSAQADSLSGEDGAPGYVDMVARFNGDIGVNPDCLTGQTWYNGFDHNNDPTTEIDLISVVMHEFAHGLGFLTLAGSNGALFNGLPDAYLVNMMDGDLGKRWPEMTDAERAASGVNSGKLVWAGDEVTLNAPTALGPRPSVLVNTPKALAGSYEAQSASFGEPLRENGGLTGKMVVANDGVGVSTDGCEPITTKLAGKIALIDRGACTFVTKVLNAQAAGAKGVIIVNNAPGGLPGMGGFDAAITIPSVGVSKADGDAFKAAAAGNIVGKLILDGQFLAGADANGYVKLYAPNPYQPGSSRSHFDTSATPNLLMEPSINDDLAPLFDLDLTVPLMKDIGWNLQ